MKSCYLAILLSVIVNIELTAQDRKVNFSVEVSTDSVLMGNYFEVRFIIENADGKNFEAPAFDNFRVVSGPNFSSSYSIMNGDINQSMTITYYLEPLETGQYFILPASVKADGKMLETAPMRVLVVPNPDGIKQNPYKKEHRLFDMFNPFNLDDDFFFSFPPRTPKETPKQEEKPLEKKKKTTRI
jgi:hypothetical protein